jgi:hypothetical protein
MCLLGALPAWSQISTVPGLEIKGPYASVKKNKDGTEEKFDKTPDERTITKRTFSAEGVLRLTTVYRMSEGGNPVNCDILDGRGIKLFKSRYGYSRNKDNPLSYGKLVEEQMFDARVKRIDPNTGEEMPVRRFVYTYNADGSQNKPYSIVLVPGKTYEEAYGAGPSGLNYDPFDPKNADKSGKSKTRK